MYINRAHLSTPRRVNGGYGAKIYARINGVTITGERLRQVRKKRGLTIRAVAKYEQISPSYLSGLERGENAPNAWPLLARLARRYRTSTDYLLGLTDDPRPASAVNVDGLVREEQAAYRTLSDEEETLLEHFRSLPEEARTSLLRFLVALGLGGATFLEGEEDQSGGGASG